VAHTCNPSFSEYRDLEDQEASLGKKFIRPYHEKTHHKKGFVEWLKV
jgi:hypothetical protein